ncbi:uncharacterized protein LOC120678001 [Panicum virgatum]|uniref:uncharacterized protein LOC120678001 n=1 Tax=Panicum virgatum TaxID=38727 RepID=UPI0019D649E5|nr:uncharacterized protein LOC120678001 [Panicum virgatum]
MAHRGPCRVRLRPGRLPHLPSDLHQEILLRLPPDQPKLLFRCAAVSKAWRNVITKAGLPRQYREHHRVPPHDRARLQLQGRTCGWLRGHDPQFAHSARPRLPDDGHNLVTLDSRHGRVLFRRVRQRRMLVLWDPLAAHYEDVLLQAEFPNANINWSVGILCAAVQPCAMHRPQ